MSSVAHPHAPLPSTQISVIAQGLFASFLLGMWGVIEGKLWRYEWLSILDGIGLSLWIGAITAIVLSLLRLLCSRLGDWISLFIYLSAGLVWAWSIADGLDAFTRLDGPHGLLAFLTILASLASGLVLALFYRMLTPRQSSDGLAPFQGKRVLLGFLAIIVTIVALFADKNIFVGIYNPFHQGLRLSALLALLWSILVVRSFWDQVQSPLRITLKKIWLVSAVIMMSVPLFSLSSSDDGRLYALQNSGWMQGALERMRSLTDADQDGHSSWFGGGDCAPFNAVIHPSAREIPDNGIDDNCRAGDLKLKHEAFQRTAMPTTPIPQSLVLITIDTLRPDHMSAFGYPKDTTPRIKAWAQKGMTFNRAYSASAWTSIAVSALMRGLYPSHLHWTRVFETSKYRLVRQQELKHLPQGESIRLSFTMPLDEDREPLAETLKARGLYTMAVVDDGYGEFLSPKMGLGRGFDRFELVDQLPRHKRTDRGTIDLALNALKERPEGKAFFLWVHLFGPHDPNQKHRDVKFFGRGIQGKYDHEIAFTDQQVGRLLDALSEVKDSEKSLGRGLTIALTSDHGELFEGNRRYHGVDLHEQSIRVPMIIEGDRFQAGSNREDPVSLVDLAPTLLASVEAPPPHAQDGVDLGSLITNKQKRILFAETWYITSKGKFIRDYVAAFDGIWKATYRRDQQLMSIAQQKEMKRPAKNWGRKEPKAQAVLTALETYLEASSNDRGAFPSQATKAKTLKQE